MSGLRILLVDDEAPARQRLRTLLGDLAELCPAEVVGEAGDGAAALDWLAAPGHAADLLLVDIRMPVMDGIELAQHIARLPQPPALVFVTAYDAHAVQAFELNAVDYLLKPVRAQRLQAALEKAAARRAAPGMALPATAPRLAGSDAASESGVPPGLPASALKNDANFPAAIAAVAQALGAAPRQHLICHERGRLLRVPVADILYLRAEQKYVVARTVEREYLLDEALVQLEEEFAERFLRLHRGALVARAALAGAERVSDGEGEAWQVLVRGVAERLPVSRRQWPLLRALLQG